MPFGFQIDSETGDEPLCNEFVGKALTHALPGSNMAAVVLPPHWWYHSCYTCTPFTNRFITRRAQWRGQMKVARDEGIMLRYHRAHGDAKGFPWSYVSFVYVVHLHPKGKPSSPKGDTSSCHSIVCISVHHCVKTGTSIVLFVVVGAWNGISVFTACHVLPWKRSFKKVLFFEGNLSHNGGNASHTLHVYSCCC